jgi:uncharacterized protein YbjT (DUF2867 family)
MTTVLVTGASGTLGRALLARPAAARHHVRALARRLPTTSADGVEWMRVDLGSGEGLTDAVAGVDVVIHAASAPRGDTARIDVGGTERLVAAAACAGVRHLVYVSIVGIDRVPVAYYRHKLAAEAVVRSGEVPWTIVRGTQFHDLIDALFRGLDRVRLPVVPRGWLCQPIHVGDFADVLWDAVRRGPVGAAREVAGPEVLTWQAMLAAWRTAQGRSGRVLALPVPGRLGASFGRGDATAPARAVGGLTWSAWVGARYGPAGR